MPPAGKIVFKGLKLRRSKDERFSSVKKHNVVLKCCMECSSDICLETVLLLKGGTSNPQAESAAVQRCTPEQRLAQYHALSPKPLKRQGSLGFMCNFSSLDIFPLVFQGLLFKTCGFIALGRIG